MALYAGIFGFLIPMERCTVAGSNKGWFELVLFISAAFLFVGANMVADHFAISNIGAQVLAVLGFVLSVISGPGFLCLYYFYRLLSQPVSVFAGVVVFRTLCHGLKSPGPLRDFFK